MLRFNLLMKLNFINIRRFIVLAFILTNLTSCMDTSSSKSTNIKLPDGSVFIGTLDENQLLSGRGELRWSTGAIYKGEFKEGLMHGDGVYTDKRGGREEGFFSKGELIKGKAVYADGSASVGNFVDGVLEGKGQMSFADDSTYVGDVKRGVPNGEGTLKTANGDELKGSFKNGLLHGNANVKHANGAYTEGVYVKGQKQGKGIFIYSNGNKYIGNFVNDLFDGQGKFIKNDGSFLEGPFKHGEYVGD